MRSDFSLKYLVPVRCLSAEEEINVLVEGSKISVEFQRFDPTTSRSDADCKIPVHYCIGCLVLPSILFRLMSVL